MGGKGGAQEKEGGGREGTPVHLSETFLRAQEEEEGKARRRRGGERRALCLGPFGERHGTCDHMQPEAHLHTPYSNRIKRSRRPPFF